MNPIVNNIMALAHRWALATYNKALDKPFEDFDEIQKALQAAIEQALGPGEPVAYQYRMRPTWGDKETPWWPWEECSKEKHRDCKNTPPLLHKWQYEARELYTTPQPQPQPKQEPASVRERWNIERDGDDLLVCFSNHEKWESCEYVRYVRAPQPKREWVGLTDEDVRELDTSEFWDDHTPADFVRLVENKLREKNGGGV
jgi:hypothetical protein